MQCDIFISYRRQSDSGSAGRLYDRLSQKLLGVPIFIDVDKLNPGDDFEQGLEKSLARCAVLLAVIGPDWVDVPGTDGQPRLSREDDFVRMELAAALSKGVRVIPLLVQGALPPSASALPAELKALAKRQAFEIRHERFNADVDALARSLLDTTPGLRRRRLTGSAKVALAALTILVLLGGGLLLYRNSGWSEFNWFGLRSAADAVNWSPWLDQETYQREFDKQMKQNRYPRMIEAKKQDQTLVYRANFVGYPSGQFAFQSRHSLSDDELLKHETRMTRDGYRRAYLQRFTDGGRAYNQGTWTKP